jgi:hypothetical protein
MADGSLKFDTKIDTEGFKEGTNKLKDIMERVVSAIKRVGSGIADAFSGTGSIDITSAKIKALVDEIDRYRDALYYMEKQGLYFGDAEYDEAYRKLSQAEQALNKYKKELAKTDNQQKKAAKSARKMSKEINRTNVSAGKFSKTLRLVRMSILYSFAFQAIRIATQSIVEGFENLAQASNKVNKDISALQTSTLMLKNSFATAFAPILSAITPVLQILINHLANAISLMGQFFAVLLTGATTFAKAKEAQVDYAASLAKTAKEANKSLSPIDKLNTVADNAASTEYKPPEPAQMFEEIEIDQKLIDKVEKFKELLRPVTDAFKKLWKTVKPFADNVGQGLKWLYDNVLVPLASWTITDLIPGFLDVLGGVLSVLNSILIAFQPFGQWLWENFLQPLASWAGETVSTGLQLIADALYRLSDWILEHQETVRTAALIIGGFFAAFKIAEFIAAITPFLTTLGTMITNGTLLSTILGNIGSILSTITGPVGIAIAAVGLLIYSFIDLWRSSEAFRESVLKMQDAWKTALEPFVNFIKDVFVSAWNDILKPAVEFFVDTLIPNLIDIFKTLWEKVLVPFGKFLATVLKPVFQIITDLLKMLWENVILPLAEAVGGVLKKAWDGIYQILKKTVIPIIEKVIEVLKFLWEKVINPIIKVLWDVLKPAFESVFKAIGGVFKGIGELFGGLIDFITGVFTGDWKKAWEGIKNIFKGIWDAIWSIIKGVVNVIISIINALIKGVVTGINAVIKALNKINFTVPDWVPLIGGKSFGFNLKELTAPQIPKLATGTVVPANYGEFLAILGDNKREPEVVSPISAMKQAFKEAIAEIGGTGAGTINLNVYLEGKQIYSEVVRQDKQYRTQTGKSAFAY